jgi:flagellar biosynthesis anti-sigma factor FlgM
MRVDFTTLGAEPPDKNQAARTGQAANGPASAAGSTSSTPANGPAGIELDQTRFSFDQSRIQSLQAQVLAQPEIRQAKVQSLQQSIENGEYSIPVSQLADALVSELGSGAGG